MWTFQAHKLTETLKGLLREGRLALLCWFCAHPTRLKWRFYPFIIINYNGDFNSQHCPSILGPQSHQFTNTGRNLCDCGISPSPSTTNTMPTCDTYCGGSMNCNNNAVSDVDGEDKCMQTTTCEFWVTIESHVVSKNLSHHRMQNPLPPIFFIGP